MNTQLLDKCDAYLRAHGTRGAMSQDKGKILQRPAVTISREAGAGGITVGQLLAEAMQQQQEDAGDPWAVFDQNLVERVLDDCGLPASVAKYMPEDGTSPLHDTVEEVLGVHPASSTLMHHTTATILKLAMAGNVILVGRGAHVITAHLPHVLHVRLVAPQSKRVRHLAGYYNLTPRQATAYMRQRDRARARYVMQNFNSRVADPCQYHLVLNTGRMSYEQAARTIARAVQELTDTRVRASFSHAAAERLAHCAG